MTSNNIDVSIQYLGTPAGTSRQERKQSLTEIFAAAADLFKKNDITVEADSLSLSGQTVTGTVPADKQDAAEKALKASGFQLRADPVVKFT